MIVLISLVGCELGRDDISSQSTQDQETTSNLDDFSGNSESDIQGPSSYPIEEDLDNNPQNTQTSDSYPVDHDTYKKVMDLDEIEPPSTALQPKEGKASISGLLYQTQGSLVLKNLDFFQTF